MKSAALKKFLVFHEMKLFGSNIKKILIFSQKEAFLKFPEIKKSLYFWKWNILALILKKFLYFLKRKLFLYLSNETLHFSPQAWKIKEIHPQKNFLYSRKQKPRKNLLCFLKRKLFLYFGKQKHQNKFLYFSFFF